MTTAIVRKIIFLYLKHLSKEQEWLAEYVP